MSGNINCNSTDKICKENQSCDSWRALIQDQNKQKKSPKKIGNSRSNATAKKYDTPEQTKKVTILGRSIVKQVKRYDLSHLLVNCKVQVKNFPGVRV